MHKAFQSPFFQVATVRFLPRVAPLPLSLTQGTTTPRHKKKRGPSTGSISAGEENCVAPYFCVQKDFAPSSSNCRRCRPGRLLTCRKVGNAPYSSVPQYTWVTSPRHPGGRQASEVAQRTCLLSLRRQRLPRPSPARRAAPRLSRTRPGKGRRGQWGATGPVPGSLPTSRSRARRALPGLPLPSPREGQARAPGWREAAAPRASDGGGGRNPGAHGRAAPPSRARQDAWGLVRPAHPRGGGLTGPGRGGRVQAAGRAGRPAGGRRVAAAPGLK